MEPDANKDVGTNWYNLRSNRGRSYSHQLDHQMDDPVSSKSYESGVQMLQQAADKMDESLTLLQEFFCQLDRKNVFEPLDASTLTASQKREALCAVNLIKEKRSGK